MIASAAHTTSQHQHRHRHSHHAEKKYRKTTRLSSELIKKLNLQMGANEVQYSVTTMLQGTTRISSYIFLWNYDDRIIVSDIDGTITKSDGQSHTLINDSFFSVNIPVFFQFGAK